MNEDGGLKKQMVIFKMGNSIKEKELTHVQRVSVWMCALSLL